MPELLKKGSPVATMVSLDSRLRGNDGIASLMNSLIGHWLEF